MNVHWDTKRSREFEGRDFVVQDFSAHLRMSSVFDTSCSMPTVAPKVIVTTKYTSTNFHNVPCGDVLLLFNTCLSGISLVVQCLRLHASNAGVADSLPGQGTKIPCPTCCVAWPKEKKKKTKHLSSSLRSAWLNEERDKLTNPGIPLGSKEYVCIWDASPVPG